MMNKSYLISDRPNTFYILSKIGVIAFFLNVFWFKYVYFESAFILYGTAILAIGTMLVDIFNSGVIDISLFPYGVTINIIMSIYSLLTGIFVAVDQTKLLGSLRTYFVYSLFCLAICYISNRENSIDWLMKTLAFVSLLCCIYTFFQGYYYIGYGYILSDKINPNNYGLILVVGVCAIVFLSKNTIGNTTLSVVLVALLLWGIIQCGSRKSLISVVMLVLFWLVPHIGNMIINEHHYGKLIGLILAVSIAFGAYYVFKNIYMGSDSQIRMLKLGNESEVSSSMRRYYYQLSWSLFLKKPLFGVGFNQFQEYSSSGLFSHSLYAESISCWGLIGCLLYYPPLVIAIVGACSIGFGTDKNTNGKKMFAILILELFMGTGQVLYYEINHLVLLTAVYCWLSNYQKKDIRENGSHEVIVHECKYIKKNSP